MTRTSDIDPALALLAGEPWYHRMLGPSSLSWQAVIFAGILNYPQMVLTGGTLGARTVQPGEYPTIALISLATVLVSFVYGYVGHKTLFRNRHVRPVSLATFLIFYAGGGLLYSVGIQVSDYVAQSPSEIPFALRAIDAMLVSITWGVAVALILDGRSRFRIERDALVEELVAEQERADKQSRIVQENRRDLTDGLDASLARHLNEITEAAQHVRQENLGSRDVRRLVTAIDTAADVGARQSSDRVWQEAVTAAATPKVGQTLAVALRSPRTWPAPTAVLIAIGVPTVAVRNFGLWWGLPATIALGLIVWLWLRVVQRWQWSPWPCWLTSFFGSTAAVSAFAVLPAPDASQAASEIGAILIGVLSGFVLVSFVATLQRERQHVLQALRAEILLEEATRLAEARAVAALARRLHGSVQTTLRVCAAEIERAAHAQDAAAMDKAVDQALKALTEATRESPSSTQTVAASLTALVESWEGFMTVTLDIDPTLIEMPAISDVDEVVGEALSNAHHHGDATAAHVTISPDPSGLRIVVRDNGFSETVRPPGLGTRLLRSLASEYDLQTSPSGAVLDVVLPGR